MNIGEKGTLYSVTITFGFAVSYFVFCMIVFLVKKDNYLRTGKHSFTVILNLRALTTCLKQEC